MNNFLISFDELVTTLKQVLLRVGFEEKSAAHCALLFAKADLDGVQSHGVNRFPLFLEFIEKAKSFAHTFMQNRDV